jgi:nickel-dependent lactate racemase
MPYGRSHATFDIEDSRVLDVLEPSKVPPSPNAEFEIEQALNAPIGGPTIEDLNPKGKHIGIAVDDTTRLTPTHILLPVILRRLEKAGAKAEMIKVFAALGTHRKMTDREMREKYGAEILEKYEVVNHDPNDSSRLKYFGTIDDLPVWINKEYAECDLRMATGNLIPHPAAGWGAGAKTLLPGLAGNETVGRMHVLSALTTRSALGMEENPTREAIEAFAAKVGLHMVINTVLARDGKIVRVFAGHFVKAHRAGIAFARKIYCVKARRLADVTVTSSFPADIEFWQGLKGLFSADLCTRPDGGIIELTPCPEGIAVKHPKWIEYLRLDTKELKQVYQSNKSEDLVALGVALHVAGLRERHHICIISDGISASEAEEMHLKKSSSVEEALEHLSTDLGQRFMVNVLKYGGETYPVTEDLSSMDDYRSKRRTA